MSGIMLALAGGNTVQLIATAQTVEDYSPGAAFASYYLHEGNVILSSNFTAGVVESYVNPPAAYTLFEAKAETVSGTTPSGSALSSYFDLNTTSPQWYLTRSTAGTTTGTFDVTIREKANTANSITVLVSLTATAGLVP